MRMFRNGNHPRQMVRSAAVRNHYPRAQTFTRNRAVTVVRTGLPDRRFWCRMVPGTLRPSSTLLSACSAGRRALTPIDPGPPSRPVRYGAIGLPVRT